jgi:arylsulfatase
VPFNRMYDPDRMPNPIRGDPATDLMDEQVRWMNYLIWADDISPARARALRARYYGEISYIDDCLGRILDAVEARPDADNTLICFFADHGDHLGDHGAWQKESFFEASCHVPFLVSWPAALPAGERREELACLTDLFGIATRAAGEAEVRDGVDLLGAVAGEAPARHWVTGMYGEPGTSLFKMMVRDPDWKYIYFANGGLEQLFDMRNDPEELRNLADTSPDVVQRLRAVAVAACDVPGARDALDTEHDLRAFPQEERPLTRIHQFDTSRGVSGFPERPEDALHAYRQRQEDGGAL